MSKYIELSRALMYIADIQLTVSDTSKPTILPRDLCEWIFEGIKDLPTIDIVNCIECAYLGEDWWCYKHKFTPLPIEDFFCKDGERIDK